MTKYRLGNVIPPFEELESIKEHKIYSLYFPFTGGYFRLVINEDDKHNISLDYIGEEGFIHGYPRLKVKGKYTFNTLYRFSKTSYIGLRNMFIKFLINYKKDIDEELNRYLLKEEKWEIGLNIL